MTPPGSDSGWSADELIPFGKYILLDRISSGATAAVYRGKLRGEAGFERVVAIKRILPHMAGDPSFVNTFVREAKIAALLNHTNICPIYELGKVGESLYMAMECVSGTDLGKLSRRVIKQGDSIPPIVAAWICSKLCDALDYAHSLKDARGRATGLIHRDLSPTNILISYEGQVKLIDFGLAKASGRAQQTNVDALKKKLGYMSPEMVKGRGVDGRADIFGCGVVLYEMLTSRRLFAGTDDMSTLKLVSAATVPPPSALMDDPPEELEMIIMRALEREPDDRWQSAHEMGEALMSFIGATDPMYGSRQMAEWLGRYFDDDQRLEQERVNVLLEASNDPRIVEERKRFFLSPDGAAAMARAEIARKLSTEPPPVMGVPKVNVPANPAPEVGATTTVRGLQPVKVTFAPRQQPVDEFDDGDEEATEFFEPTRGRGAAISDTPEDEEKTEFLDDRDLAANKVDDEPFGPEQTEYLEGDQFAAMTLEERPLEAARKDGFGFDEDATEIFFNKEDGVGVDELMNQGGEIAASSTSAPPPMVGARPVAIPMPGPLPAAPQLLLPTSTEIDRSRQRAVGRATMQIPVPQARSSGWLLALGLILLALAVAGVIAKTPVGVALGLRSPSVGSIEIRTTPAVGAAVKLDEVFRGRAPIRMDGVRTGKRRIEIFADGYLPAIREVHMTGGKTALVDVTLVPRTLPVPAPPPPPPPQKVIPETPAPEPSEAVPPPKTQGANERTTSPAVKAQTRLETTSERPKQSAAAVSKEAGTLSVNSRPWSAIFINDEDIGKNTPLFELELPAGTHKVSLRTPDGIKHTEWVQIRANQNTRITREYEQK